MERNYEYWHSEVAGNISEETMNDEEDQEVDNILFGAGSIESEPPGLMPGRLVVLVQE